jgi:hypothetical protein
MQNFVGFSSSAYFAFYIISYNINVVSRHTHVLDYNEKKSPPQKAGDTRTNFSTVEI